MTARIESGMKSGKSGTMKRIAKILAAAAAGIALVSTALLASHAAEGDRKEVESMNAAIRIEVGGTIFFADLEPNAAAEAFLKQLPMAVVMTELNGNEKYFELPKRLPANAVRPGRIHCGDLMLFGSSTVVLFYESFSTPYAYTRLGRLRNAEGLKAALGAGNPAVVFSMEPEPTKSQKNERSE